MGTLETLIVCKSIHHQNTARVAEAMAEVLHANVVDPLAADYGSLERCDLIGLGSGIYFGRFHSELRKWVGGLPQGTSRQLRLFIFSTSGLSVLWRLWHWPLKRVIQNQGHQIVGEFHCCGFDTFGPLQFIGGINLRRPNDRDLQLASDFAKHLLQSTVPRVSEE